MHWDVAKYHFQLDRGALCKTSISNVLILLLWNSTAHILMYLKNQIILLYSCQTLANTSDQYQNYVIGFCSKLWCFLLFIWSLYLRPSELFCAFFGAEMLLDVLPHVQQQVKSTWETDKGFLKKRMWHQKKRSLEVVAFQHIKTLFFVP